MRRSPLLWLAAVLAAGLCLDHAVGSGPSAARASTDVPTLSTLISRARTRPGSIHLVVFDPNTRLVEMTLKNGDSLRAYYPSDQSQVIEHETIEREEFESLVAREDATAARA